MNVVIAPNKLHAVVDAAQCACFMLTCEGAILESNEAASNMFGYTQTEFLLLTRSDIIDHTDTNLLSLLAWRKQQKKATGEIIGIRKNGEKFPAILSSVMYFDNETGKELVIKMITDLSELRKQERLLLETNRVARVGGWEFNVQTNTLQWTEITREIHEVDDDFVPDIYKAISFYDDSENRDTIRTEFKALLEEGKPFDFRMVITTAKGTKKHIRAIGKAERIRGIIARVYGTLQDISQEIELAERLNNSEAEFKGAFEHSAIGMAIVGTDETILQVNEALCELLGYEKKVLQDLHFANFTHPDELETDQRYRILLKEKKIDSLKREKRFIHKNGSVVWAYIAVAAIRKADSSLLYFIAQIEDITKRKNAEFNLAKSEQQFRSLFDQNPDAVYSIDNEGVFVSMNTQLAVLLETSLFELQGKSFIPFCLPADLPHVFSHFEKVKTGISQTYEATAITAKGNTKNVLITNIPIIVNGVITGTYGIAKDITERVQSNKNLQKALGELEQIMHSSLDVICVINADGLFTQINQAATNTWGYSREELIGKKYIDFVSEEDAMNTNRAASILLKGQGVSNFENRYKHKNGSIVNMSWSAIWDSTASCMYGIGRDITEMKKKEHERITLINELSQINKDLTQFSYITSHNLRAPVTNLLALSKLVNWNTLTDDSNKMVLKSIEKSTQQLNNTINDLIKIMVLKEKREIPARLVSFESVLQKVCYAFTTIIEEQEVTIHADFTQAPEIIFNVEYLESIFTNLLSNAIKFRSPIKKPTITICSRKLEKHIELVFSDNGSGIDLKLHKNRIFKLFQTFHHHRDSKGVGLYLIQSQLHAMGGEITLSSEPGQGCAFTLLFKKL